MCRKYSGGVVLNINEELSSSLDIKKLSEPYCHLAGWGLLCVCNSCVKGLGPHEKGLDYFEGSVNSSSLKFPTGSLQKYAARRASSSGLKTFLTETLSRKNSPVIHRLFTGLGSHHSPC